MTHIKTKLPDKDTLFYTINYHLEFAIISFNVSKILKWGRLGNKNQINKYRAKIQQLKHKLMIEMIIKHKG